MLLFIASICAFHLKLIFMYAPQAASKYYCSLTHLRDRLYSFLVFIVDICPVRHGALTTLCAKTMTPICY